MTPQNQILKLDNGESKGNPKTREQERPIQLPKTKPKNQSAKESNEITDQNQLNQKWEPL